MTTINQDILTQNLIESAPDSSIRPLIAGQSGKEWFDFVLPCPQELKDVGAVSFHDKRNEELLEKYGHQDWYSWSLENWGCKWNCDAQDWDRTDDTITFWFDSPWGPPINLYDEMVNQGFDVEAYYHEEGKAYVG